MTSINDLRGRPATEMGADLDSGLSTLSLNQVVEFTEYVRTVLPIDGYVFWVKAGGSPRNVKGALHFSTTLRQDEDATQAVNQVTLSTTTPVADFAALAPNAVLIACFKGMRFAFSVRGPFFQAAGLYHYGGTALLPTMASQVLDNTPDEAQAIVSNSLPIWLGLNTYFPPYLSLLTAPYPAFTMPSGLTLYPSFAVPQNLEPPYGAVHIAPDATEILGGSPFLDQTLSSYVLTKDRVRITLYGCNNIVANTFLNFVLQYSEDTSNIGVMNRPIIRDGKKTQAEIAALAQQKIIDFEVSYQQTAARSVARQMIAKATVGYIAPPALTF